ncbi:DegT/DnrJ/EryC1/StrS family aminotransferase [Dactylosporangium sp. CA-052675]|uniref:DegT/DnrJ/EryC1/StrS family aminotransferase n=1 Tax=Dactylosporangium sp. CA-052675 TaxID=3239927 RepID=UPI003D91212B
MIPLVDLKAAHAEVAEDVALGFKRILENTAFIGGAEVTAFEREYAEFSGVAHCVGVANGTDALELALRAAGVGPGDEVILPANTFIATAEAVARINARVVLVDCDPRTYLIDVDAALAAVGPKTRAIVPVHLYGQLAPVERLRAGLASTARTDVVIVEDAAQCQGATRFGAGAGAEGIAATSFYPGKNLGAYGDAGAVVAADEALAVSVRTISSHGGLTKYVHDVVGFNSRLDALQAVVLRAKLTRLAGWNAARRAAAARYDELLEGLDVTRPVTLDGNEHVWHLYVVREASPDGSSTRRDEVLARLNAAGIGAGIHYPYPIHLTPAFAGLGHAKGSFPHAEQAAVEILTLPLFPQITPDQQEIVVEALRAARR